MRKGTKFNAAAPICKPATGFNSEEWMLRRK
jgi:hypothetical protein